MTTTALEDLLPWLPRVDREWEARKQRLWALTPEERVAAMRARELSYRELAHWSAVRPDEVPRLATGQGGPGEFEWIAMLEPSIAENDEAARRVRIERAKAARIKADQARAAARRSERAR